jgi:hypothetical protein
MRISIDRSWPLWVSSRPFPRYYRNDCFRDQSSRSPGKYSELASERLRSPIAVVQITPNLRERRAAYGQMKTAATRVVQRLRSALRARSQSDNHQHYHDEPYQTSHNVRRSYFVPSLIKRSAATWASSRPLGNLMSAVFALCEFGHILHSPRDRIGPVVLARIMISDWLLSRGKADAHQTTEMTKV